MKSAERLSNRVRECRKRAGIRQSDLAEQVEVTRQTIIAIEKERFNPSVALGLRIARVLGESMDALFTLEPLDGETHVEAPVALPEVTAAGIVEVHDVTEPSESTDEMEETESPAPEETFEVLATMMGPDEENVSNDPTGILPSPLDGSVTSPIQGVWDF
jgi:putative transcriptional regulator